MPNPTPTPADLAQCLAQLQATPPRLTAFARLFADAQLAARPAPKAWSPAEVLAHLRGCDEVWTHTIYAMLAHDAPGLAKLDPRRVAWAAQYAALPFSASLRTFSRRRFELLAVLQTLPLERWKRAAVIGGRTHTVFSQARRLALHEHRHCQELEDQT
jgi:hypothetical protein